MDHGLDFTDPHLIVWSVALPILHIILVAYFREKSICSEKTSSGSRGSDILACNIVSTVCVSWCSVTGILGYLNISNAIDNMEIFNDKFYAKSLFVQNYVVTPMFCYQVWNLIACLIHNQFRTADAIGHHIVTGAVAYFALRPFGHYYALFYAGISECSTISLNFVSTFTDVPELSKKYPQIFILSKIIFGCSYFIIRMVIWPILSIELWLGCRDLLVSGKAQSNVVVGFLMFANMFLTGLQLYWGYLLVKAAMPKKDKYPPGSKKMKDI